MNKEELFELFQDVYENYQLRKGAEFVRKSKKRFGPVYNVLIQRFDEHGLPEKYPKPKGCHKTK